MKEDCCSSVITLQGSEKEAPDKKKAKRFFRKIWLEVKGFKPWLVFDQKIPTHAECSLCRKKIGARFSTLVDHAKSNEHLRLSGQEKAPPSSDFEIPAKEKSKEEIAKVTLELKVLKLCTKLNIAFDKIPVLLNELQDIDPNCIWKDLKIGATKGRNMIVNVVGAESREELASILRDNYFTICIDESTDIAKEKALAIIIRYSNPNDGYVYSKTWHLARIFQKNKKAKATAQRLFDCLNNSFEMYDIPMTNIYACCSDGCQTMIGEKSGLKAKLNEAIPNIICVQCPAHMTHLCVQYAIRELPECVMKLFTNTHAMLRSGNRQHDYEELQNELGIVAHKILRISTTRWLSLEACVNRLIEQYDSLLTFAERLVNDKDVLAETVAECMRKSTTIQYLYLLRKTLGEMNILNKFFQTRGVVIHKAGEQIEKTYKNIVSCFLKREYVMSTPAADINFTNESNYLRFTEFELGGEIREFLLSNNHDTKTFCVNIFNFLMSLSMEMKERFKFNDSIYQLAACLDPKNVLSSRFREDHPNIFFKLLRKCIKLVNSEDLFIQMEEEWENILSISIPDYVLAPETRIEDFWLYIQNYENDDGTMPCAAIGDLALLILAIPHANADPERCFSAQNNIKNKNKNKMLVESVDAVMRTKERTSGMGPFEPPEQMVNLGLRRRYYKNKYAQGRVV